MGVLSLDVSLAILIKFTTEKQKTVPQTCFFNTFRKNYASTRGKTIGREFIGNTKDLQTATDPLLLSRLFDYVMLW